MKNIIKLLFLFVLSLTYTSSFANQLDFYGDRSTSWDILLSGNILKVNDELSKFYKQTGLNTDVVVLGKNDECYLEANFDTCVQENHNYSSDLIIILSMKSDIKSRGDIRTLIKDDYKEVLPPSNFKSLQDNITSYFATGDFTGGITNYLSLIKDSIDNKCLEVGFEKGCDIIKLSKEYHSFVAEKEYEKKYNAMMKIIYYVIFFVLIIVTYKGLKKYYISRLNNLYKDTKYKIDNSSEYNVFEKDRETIIYELEVLKSLIKNKLGDLDKNTFYLRKTYKSFKSQFMEIERKISSMQKSFSEREELKEKVEKMKKIDL